MRVRQPLDFQPARLVADKDPVPLGPLTAGTFDQFLIDKPWLNRAEITEPRPRNTRNFRRHGQRFAGDASPVIVIDSLFKQIRSLTPARGFAKKFPARIED